LENEEVNNNIGLLEAFPFEDNSMPLIVLSTLHQSS
jgi:hypothetical protein